MSKLFPRVLGTHSSKSWSVTRVAQEKHSGDKPPLGLRKGPCFTQKMPEKSRKKQQIKSAPWATHDLPRARSVWEGEVQEVARPRYVGGKLIHHPPPLHCFKIRDPASQGRLWMSSQPRSTGRTQLCLQRSANLRMYGQEGQESSVVQVLQGLPGFFFY